MIDYDVCSDCENFTYLDNVCPRSGRIRCSESVKCDLFRLYSKRDQLEKTNVLSRYFHFGRKCGCTTCDHDCK